MVTERIPGQFAEQPMILMRVALPMCEDQVRLYLLFEFLKGLLHLCPLVREKAVPKFLQHDCRLASGGKQAGGALSLFAPLTSSRKHHPVKARPQGRLSQMQDRASAADLNIIRMRAQAENFQG